MKGSQGAASTVVAERAGLSGAYGATVGMRVFGFLGAACMALGNASAQDVWEQPPIEYSKAVSKDPAASIGRSLADGSLKLSATTPLERVKELLGLLKIPVESQVLVFSKTSKQNPLIDPGNPRALYFSENAYAGYVPGGQMEIIAHDPVLGPVFQVIDLGGPAEIPAMQRRTADCLSCHGTARTLDVPGVLVRSVFADADGRPLLEFGSVDVNATTPLEQRWGGYYVTGRSSLPHLGNRFFRSGEQPETPTGAVHLDQVGERVDPTKYPRATSDIVALLVLEHQCQVYNLMTTASYRYRRMQWMAKAFDPNADPDTGTAGKLADEDALKIVDALLYKDAAPLGDGVEGTRHSRPPLRNASRSPARAIPWRTSISARSSSRTAAPTWSIRRSSSPCRRA
ncbi:MAG: hypothetical protein QM755_15370 [Luteolibacter sp.]